MFGICFYSKIVNVIFQDLELCFPRASKDKSWNASLDRIDSSKGYIEGNVQWVHQNINMMKNKFDNQYFIEMCKLITKNN